VPCIRCADPTQDAGSASSLTKSKSDLNLILEHCQCPFQLRMQGHLLFALSSHTSAPLHAIALLIRPRLLVDSLQSNRPDTHDALTCTLAESSCIIVRI